MSAHLPSPAEAERVSTLRLVRVGFVAMLPLWAAAIPFGVVYSVAALEAGWRPLTVQLMSLTVFSAATQVSVATLSQADASSLEILITAGALNIHLLLIGAAIARELPLMLARRLGVAALLTDASYAVAASKPPLRLPVLIGSGISMYAGWNLGTALGLLAGQSIPDPQRIALDLVVPLTFIAVLTPMLRSRPNVAVAAGSAVGTLALAAWLPLGFAILTAGSLASLAGAWAIARQESGDRRHG
jgi:predicted branched-subunit amino acid permease